MGFESAIGSEHYLDITTRAVATALAKEGRGRKANYSAYAVARTLLLLYTTIPSHKALQDLPANSSASSRRFFPRIALALRSCILFG